MQQGYCLLHVLEFLFRAPEFLFHAPDFNGSSQEWRDACITPFL
jgi:hypothetical protein